MENLGLYINIKDIWQVCEKPVTFKNDEKIIHCDKFETTLELKNNAQNSPYFSWMSLGDNTRRPFEIYNIKTLSGIIRFIDIFIVVLYPDTPESYNEARWHIDVRKASSPPAACGETKFISLLSIGREYHMCTCKVLVVDIWLCPSWAIAIYGSPLLPWLKLM